MRSISRQSLELTVTRKSKRRIYSRGRQRDSTDIRSQSVASFSRAPLSSRRTINELYTSPEKSSPSTTNIPTTNRSVPRAHACSSVANTQKLEPPHGRAGAQSEEMTFATHPECQFMQHLRGAGWIKARTLPQSVRTVKSLLQKGWIEKQYQGPNNEVFLRLTEKG